LDSTYIIRSNSMGKYITNKLASSKLRYSETMTHRLTGVKCRATSVAKNSVLLKTKPCGQVLADILVNTQSNGS